MDVLAAAFISVVIAFVVNIAIALYGVFLQKNYLKKVLSLIVFSDTLSIIAILVGYRLPNNTYPSPPILPRIPESPAMLREHASLAVDPFPQAFVITAVVINLAVFSLLLGFALLYYKHFKTEDFKKVEEGEEVVEEIY